MNGVDLIAGSHALMQLYQDKFRRPIFNDPHALTVE